MRLAYEKIADMKKLAALLIVLGSGLAAYGISGFGLTMSAFVRSDGLAGWYEWPIEARVQIVVGVISLVGGLLLRKDSK